MKIIDTERQWAAVCTDCPAVPGDDRKTWEFPGTDEGKDHAEAFAKRHASLQGHTVDVCEQYTVTANRWEDGRAGIHGGAGRGRCDSWYRQEGHATNNFPWPTGRVLPSYLPNLCRRTHPVRRRRRPRPLGRRPPQGNRPRRHTIRRSTTGRRGLRTVSKTVDIRTGTYTTTGGITFTINDTDLGECGITDCGQPAMIAIDLDGRGDVALASAENESKATGAVMRRVGKARAGRELDGRTWDEYPETVTA